jgi:uncharacterized protein with GYD domain
MPKYMTVASYTSEGAKGLIKEGGSGRRAAVEKAVAGLGGRLEGFYFAFGGDDVYVISEAPDHVTVAALSLAVSASGLVRARTIVLLSPEEMDAAAKKTVAYRGPGQ